MLKNTQATGKGTGVVINNNIEQTVKSSHEKTTVRLEDGKSIISMAGGIAYPIMYKEVLAGEYISNWKIDNLTRMLTPLVPTLDRIFVTAQAYFVPHTRVWDQAEQALAGKTDMENRFHNENNGTNFTKLPVTTVPAGFTKYSYFRDTLLARYGVPNNIGEALEINILPIRGYQAIYNDFLRNKDYELPKLEFNGSNVTLAEEQMLKPFDIETGLDKGYIETRDAYMLKEAPTRRSYLTNIKASIEQDPQGGEAEIALADGQDTMYKEHAYGSRSVHLDWQTRFQDAKQRADNANKNDWDIIAEMGGTKPVLADRVQLLGEIDYEMNYQQITQSSPTIDNSGPLGTTGSFSYTKASGTLFNHKEFVQAGYIHVILFVNIEKMYEASINKELLKTSTEDMYRPGMSKKEVQVILNGEINAKREGSGAGGSLKDPAAYQPPWAEYKRMPNLISGEMRSRILEGTTNEEWERGVTNSHWHNVPEMEYPVAPNFQYFNPGITTNEVIARNNILNIEVGDIGTTQFTDPLMNMSIHKIKTAQPIVTADLKQYSKAEKDR